MFGFGFYFCFEGFNLFIF